MNRCPILEASGKKTYVVVSKIIRNFLALVLHFLYLLTEFGQSFEIGIKLELINSLQKVHMSWFLNIYFTIIFISLWPKLSHPCHLLFILLLSYSLASALHRHRCLLLEFLIFLFLKEFNNLFLFFPVILIFEHVGVTWWKVEVETILLGGGLSLFLGLLL